jgi:hypothetical protein
MAARSSKPVNVFPPPGHDHGRCEADAMAHAEALCAERAQRLTPTRRRVLEALVASHKPIGAYEIIDRLADRGRRRSRSIGRSISCWRTAWFIASKAATPSWPASTSTSPAPWRCF